MSQPLLDLFDLLGRKNALQLVLFLQGGSQPFGSITAHLAVNGPQVSQRLKELREAGIVEVDEGGDYRLTSTGRRILGALDGLAREAASWAAMSPRQRSPRGAATRGLGE